MNAMAIETSKGNGIVNKKRSGANNKKRSGGEKFIDKYNVETVQFYKTLPDKLTIPPPGHALYDLDGNTECSPRRVAEIDADGDFAGAILVWSNPDDKKLYVVDGRGCLLDVEAVNRIRAARGDEPVKIKFARLDTSLERAIEHVTLRNFHRKLPTLGHYGREVVKFHRMGKTFSRIADLLNLSPEESSERQLRWLAALTYCIPNVVSAIESGRLSIRTARQFGGKEMDGSERLGEDEQFQLLAEKLDEGPKEKSALTAADKKRVVAALRDNAEAIKSKADREAARIASAVLARVGGDAKALSEWPELAMLVNSALVKGVIGAEGAD